MSTPVDRTRWHRIETALEAALNAPPESCELVIADFCGGDAELIGEVRSLLAAHRKAGDFLESSASTFASGHLLEDREPAERAGTLVGRYRLIEELGRGGMGAVWLAERADGQFEQRVALKLIKRGMDSDEILARFLRERQILARLTHPNIARLLDGGVSDDGRSYFVMELVQGEPITRYCEGRRLGVEARLRVLVTVCRAVQYAHRNLVVHRDLKPSNILMTDAGEIKLLDFGVAKLLTDEGPAEKTQPGRLLTPEYASPEQVTGGGITTASDVYQLGILLYELLTGSRPFGGSKSALPDREPTPPSARAGRALRNRLRGDLDAIALRALRYEPDGRYPSAEALAEDLERHLAQEPIRYGAGGLRYRAGKFVRRNRVRLVGALVAALASVGATSAYLVRVRAERDRAERDAAKAAETAALLRRFVQGWDPDAADRGRVSAETVLGDAVARAEQELKGDPEMLAATLSAIGDLYGGLGKTARADSLLLRALAIQEGLGSRADYDRAATLARRGRLHGGIGRSQESERLFRQALALYRSALQPGRPELLRAEFDLADVLIPQDKSAEAEALLRSLLRTTDETASFATEVRSRLGYVLFRQARYAEAAGLLRATLSRQRELFGEFHRSTLQTLRNLASSLRDPGDLPEAEALDRRALEVSRALFGPDHPETAITLNSLCILLERKGDFAEAERVGREALRLKEEHSRQPTVDIALLYRTLGGLRLIQGDLAGAEPLLRRSLAMLHTLDPGNPDEGDVRNRLAYLTFRRGGPDSSDVYREAVAFEQARAGRGPFFITDGYEYLGWAARHQGDLSLAEPLYRRAVDLYRNELPVNHPYRKQAEAGLRELGR